MKKLLFVLMSVFLCLVPCFSMSNKKDLKDSEMEMLTGYVRFYGNEPFAYLGIKTEGDCVYKIVATKELLSELANRQGEELVFLGNNVKSEIENILMFEVKKVEKK